MKLIFVEFQKDRKNLLPFTYTRPIVDIRCGILKISEKWQKYTGLEISYKTEDYLQEKFRYIPDNQSLIINSTVLPDTSLVEIILQLPESSALYINNVFVAAKITSDLLENWEENLEKLTKVETEYSLSQILNLWDIFRLNGQEIEKDFKLLTKGKKSQIISNSNTVFGKKENIFIEEGARVECSVLNVGEGFIYIGKNAEVMENSVIRGSLALCDNAVLKVRSTIYGPTTVGPYSKVGGEINNSVIFGYSNKAHDGFLGNSVLGEWCNLGAGTNNSNLKNNYAQVKLWNYAKGGFVKTGLQFCGLIMGDHSKCGINTMFNTGTVVGVSANIYGDGFPRNFIPSYSWGGAMGFSEYNFEKAMQTAEIVMKRRNKELNEVEKNILQKVFELSQEYRHK